jgi:hypothetical protein
MAMGIDRRGTTRSKRANLVVPDKSLLFQEFEGALLAAWR